MRLYPPAAACREATEAADRVPQGKTGSEYIRRLEHRKHFAPHVKKCRSQRGEKTAVEYPCGLQGRERKDFVPVLVDRGVERDHEHLGARNSGERAVDTQVEHGLLLQPRFCS